MTTSSLTTCTNQPNGQLYPPMIRTLSEYKIVITKTLQLAIVFFLTLIQIYPSHQICPPKVCTCDDVNLEVRCRGSLGVAGLPYTLNPHTRKIFINYAQTSQISSDFLTQVKKLEILDLAFNKIAIIDFDQFKENQASLFLNTSHNNIQELKDLAVFQALNKLRQKSISPSSAYDDNDINVLKSLRKQRISITELALSYNQISILRSFIFLRLYKLVRLDLSYNLISTIENDAFFGLAALEYLNLRGNHLTEVPSLALQSSCGAINSSNLPSLEQRSSSIKTIDLSENVFVAIDQESFNSMDRLQELYMDQCSTQSIYDNALVGLTSLKLLSMQDNELYELSSSVFRDLNNLKILKLNGIRMNKLRYERFKYLRNLEELQISNSSLVHIQAGAFEGLLSLRKLDLSHNTQLNRIIPGVFRNLPSLHYLSFLNSTLGSLSREVSELPLKLIDLRGNSLECDCDLKWLTNWTRAHNQSVNQGEQSSERNLELLNTSESPASPSMRYEFLNITCAKPPALAGKPIIDLHDNGLECLHPTSSLNVYVGFACLSMMLFTLTLVCSVNVCRNEKQLMGVFKNNLVQNRLSMMMYHDHSNNVTSFTKHQPVSAPQAESVLYEPVDYSQTMNGPVYTMPDLEDQLMYDNPEQSQLRTMGQNSIHM